RAQCADRGSGEAHRRDQGRGARRDAQRRGGADPEHRAQDRRRRAFALGREGVGRDCREGAPLMEIFQDPETWGAVATVIFVVLTARRILRALNKMLDDRTARIRSELAEAERLRGEAEKLLADYQRRQRQALKDAEEILAHAKSEAERIRKES